MSFWRVTTFGGSVMDIVCEYEDESEVMRQGDDETMRYILGGDCQHLAVCSFISWMSCREYIERVSDMILISGAVSVISRYLVDKEIR